MPTGWPAPAGGQLAGWVGSLGRQLAVTITCICLAGLQLLNRVSGALAACESGFGGACGFRTGARDASALGMGALLLCLPFAQFGAPFAARRLRLHPRGLTSLVCCLPLAPAPSGPYVALFVARRLRLRPTSHTREAGNHSHSWFLIPSAPSVGQIPFDDLAMDRS